MNTVSPLDNLTGSLFDQAAKKVTQSPTQKMVTTQRRNIRRHNAQLIADLRAIRADLERGWTSGKLADANGNHCLIGAAQYETIGFVFDGETMLGKPNRGANNIIKAAYLVPHLYYEFIKPLRNARYRRVVRALKRQLGATTTYGLTVINDIHNQKIVLNILDQTIKSVEARS